MEAPSPVSRLQPTAREITQAERIADLCVHAIGLGAAVIGVAVLLALGLPRSVGGTAVGLALYGCGLLAMLTFSMLYNFTLNPRRKAVLRRLDHAAIFVMIAGTYTPFILAEMAGPWGSSVLAAVWAMAAAGVVVKLVWPERLRRATIMFYLAMGWVAIVILGPVLESLGPKLGALMLAGGALYSTGIIFHVWNGLRFNTAIWHGFVVAAAACHYVAILGAIALGVSPRG